jgi:hypothetical protein
MRKTMQMSKILHKDSNSRMLLWEMSDSFLEKVLLLKMERITFRRLSFNLEMADQSVSALVKAMSNTLACINWSANSC